MAADLGTLCWTLSLPPLPALPAQGWLWDPTPQPEPCVGADSRRSQPWLSVPASGWWWLSPCVAARRR